MNDSDVAISRAIDAKHMALSESIVDRQYRLHPELRDRYGERGQAKCVEDTRFHLAHLSAALLASSPGLFAGYMAWVGSALTSAGILAEDVSENLACFGDIFREQLPESMAETAVRYVESARKRLVDPPPKEPSYLREEGSPALVAREYLRLLLACQRQAAGSLIVNAVDSGMPIRDVYLEVFQPCQRELGRLWQVGQITPAQEHYCTAATQLIMSQLAPRLFITPRNGHRAVVACVSGESHEVGTRMVADLLELAGWDTIYLGGGVPARAVVRSLVDHQADLLAASATMTYHLPAVIDLIAAVRAEPACAQVRIMVGGYLFDSEPGLWERVGADGHVTNADEACQLADRLIAHDPIAMTRGEHPPLDPSHLVTTGQFPDDLFDELGRVNSEVVALNRELARKNAEVERLHAELSSQALGLATADLRKNEFLAMLGHELRNPLAPIRNALAMLGPDDPDQETVRWARDMIARQVRQMVRLVDDLFDLSRIMQGKLDLRMERLELADVIADAVETARPIIDAKGHALTVLVPDVPIVLNGDPVRLAQALTNLLTNAAKYSHPGGDITLSARSEGSEVEIRVRDSGVGIAPEMLPQIFELFMQEGRSSGISQGGLGVGLALVKSLVEVHGGHVLARSAGLGQGSEFLIRLPIPVGAEIPGPKVVWNATRARWRSQRILVVDDNEDSAIALGKLLRRVYGQEVEIAHDGPSALAVAQTFRPEVVLLDIGLPGMDGNEVARRMKALPGFEAVTLLAVTGWGQDQDRQKSREAGFAHHFVKPVDPEAILDLIQEATGGGDDSA